MIAGCRRGDRQARRDLFELTSERIFRLLHRMTGSRDDASDLSQETFLKAFAQIEKFDGRSSVATWLYRIAVNEALQFFRRAKTARSGNEASTHASGDCPADTATIRIDVQAALTEVDALDRAILLLRYQDGLDYREIAEVVGCAEGTVGSRLSRARDRLREILREGYDLREETVAHRHPKGDG